MKKLKCIIVDDEPVARKIIREFVEQVNFLVLTGEFENAFKAENFLKHEQADLVFLDIEMPKLSGVDWLKESDVKPLVILTTAFAKYALEGYELDIIDYLLKPISFNRFLKAVQKAKDFISIRNNSNEVNPSWLFVRSDKRIEKIELDDILYIESTGNYINIHTKDKNIIAYLTLKAIENELPTSGFVKIHQSFIVSFSKIEAIEGNTLKVNNTMLPIGRSYRDAFMKVVDERLVKR
jgi:DNA-binding LytR/AlgR family response regulator